MTRADLLRQVAAIAVDLELVAAPASSTAQYSALCRSARLAFGAAAVSVAETAADRLRYVASDGEGAEAIVGVEMPVSDGIAGYVAATGQAMAIDRAADDARFARAVAERTGYVPTTLLAVPVLDARGEVIGVLSVLDRSIGSADSLALASSFAAQLALIMPAADSARRGARLLLAALSEAVAGQEATLAPALRRALRDLPSADDHLVRIAGVLAELRLADPATRARVWDLVEGIAGLANAKRRLR